MKGHLRSEKKGAKGDFHLYLIQLANLISMIRLQEQQARKRKAKWLQLCLHSISFIHINKHILFTAIRNEKKNIGNNMASKLRERYVQSGIYIYASS